ncbi:hypothetical protein SOVF_120450 [Spinacia oleracea]|nr:hypothetical protein SOVF_120450 [Spinacia oleracea]
MSPLEIISYTIAIAIAIAIAIITYYLITTIIFRHPRPLPPGPKPWPIVGNLPHMGPVPHQGLAALAQKYGPLLYMRLGYVHVVVAASASVAAQFLKTHDANFSSRPPNSGAKHIAYNYQDMVFAPYGQRWRLLRKISSLHLFSTKAMEDYKPIRQEEVGILTKALVKAESKEAVQLGQLLNVCTTNALSRVMLGKRVFGDGTGESDKKSEEFKDMVMELMVLAGEFNIGDFVPALEWLDLQGIATKMKKLHKRFDNFLGAILEEHKAKFKGGNFGGDFLSTLISLKDNCDGEGGKLTDIEIKALLLLAHGLAQEKLNMEEAYGLTLQRKVPLMVYPLPRLPAKAYTTTY